MRLLVIVVVPIHLLATGHRSGKNLAFAYLRDPTARDGLSVDILGVRYPAEILPDAPFDPSNLRLRLGGS